MGPTIGLSAVFPHGRMMSPKVRVFVDFLVERLNLDADFMQLLCPDQRAGHDTQERRGEPAGARTTRVRALRAPAEDSETVVAGDGQARAA